MNTPISFDNLKSICPAVFATKPSDKVSDKYSFVPTIEVIENFQKEGWNVFSAQQRGSGSYGRHMIRLRNGDLPQVGDSLIEAIITNSHDGTAKLNISSGLFRLVCSNGLVIPQGVFESIQVLHKNIEFQDVKEISNQISETLPLIQGSMKTMQERILTFDEKRDFAKEAIELRWENNKNVKNISLNDMIIPTREGDMGDDMWKVFNVVQEKLVRGGLIYKTESGRNVRTRQLTDVVGNTKFNRELWELASSF